MLVPGLPQWAWHQRERAVLLGGSYAAALSIGVFAWGTALGAVLVAFYPLSPDKNLFAGSYETKGEHTALILAYKADVPGEVLFSSCWGCGGEGGALQLGDDGRVQIVQR